MKKIVFLLVVLFSISITPVFATSPPPVEPPPEEDNSGIIGALLDGIKGLFIPDEDFFVKFNEDISSAWDKKIGGLTGSWTSITDQFKSFKSCSEDPKNHSLEFEIKDNHFFNGYKGTKVDFLMGIGDFSKWIKGLSSALVVIVTVFFGYKKLVSMFRG